jgi:ABC-type branched-subunit amino acid transport system ATPase component
VVLASTVAVALAFLLINRARLGRLLKALGESPLALQSGGMSVLRLRIAAFCVSTFVAAVAGALSGMIVGLVDGSSYDPVISLTFVIVVVITLGGEPWYALIGGMALALIPGYLTFGNVSYYLAVSFGVTAVLIAVRGQPQPPRLLASMLVRPIDAPVPTAAPVVRLSDRQPTAQRYQDSLEILDLTVDFGGLRAVDSLSLSAESGAITGLIGPNGAGKTTTFNACTGLVHPTRGEILFGGKRVERLTPPKRAQRGLGRTFQQVQLYEALNVYENVLLGADAVLAGASLLGTLAGRRGDGERARTRAQEAMAMCGLESLARRPVASLPTGHRRLVDVARCLAGRFSFILLDEPSAGLDRSETRDLAALLQYVIAEWNIGILLVEHDIELVGDICSSIYVMDFGRLIAQGEPEAVLRSEEVQRAYLGEFAAPADSRP